MPRATKVEPTTDSAPESASDVVVEQTPTSPAPTALVPSTGAFVQPAATVKQAVEAFQQYQQLKDALGDAADFVEIGGKRMPKKSFVRKVQRFFGLSVDESIRDEPFHGADGEVAGWLATVRASHPNGASQIGDGSVTVDEKSCSDHYPFLGRTCKKCMGNATLHNIRAHAMTRAKNRAIMDLVGFGDVTADEMPPGELRGGGGRSGGGRKFKRGDQGFGECPKHAGWFFEDSGYGPSHPIDGTKSEATGKAEWCEAEKVVDKSLAPVSGGGRSKPQNPAHEAWTLLNTLFPSNRDKQSAWIAEKFPELAEREYRKYSVEDWGNIIVLAREHAGIETPPEDGESPAQDAIEELPW